MRIIDVLRNYCLSYIFLVLVSALLVTPAQSTTSADVAVAFSGQIAGDTASTRFFMDFDKSVSVKTFYMDHPNRIIIDFDEASFNFGEDSRPKPRGLITAIQFGRISEGHSRIVLTLAAPSEIIKASMQQRLDEETYRFLLDIDSTDEQTYAKLLEQQRQTIGDTVQPGIKEKKLSPAIKNPNRFLIVLDPGHGGIDSGAVGRKGTLEKEVVLSFAKSLKAKIAENGPFDVKMTRSDDTFLSLRQRLDYTKASKADLFISIHADSVRQRFVRGSTIYTLSKRASDKFSEQLAEQENQADLVAGVSLKEESAGINDILSDLTARETKRFSKRFSGLVVENMKSEIRLIKNPQRSAAFAVLKAPDVPSVLIELGYLSNTEDEKLLRSKEWRNKTANAITQAVSDFFKPRIIQ